jgi:flagellar hook-associated protein 1 FlgK
LDTVSVKIAYNTTGFSGNGNGGNAAALAKVRLAKSLNNDADGSPTQSIGDFYSAVIGRMGIEKNENKARKETREFLIAQMDSEQGSIAGVSLDEEMTNMIKFENSYKASAKYIQTVSQMLDILMSI